MGSKCLIKKNSYYDSVTLMIITKEIEAVEGVLNAVVVMGTEHNKELLSNVGLLNPETSAASPNDLIIAVKLEDDKIFEGIVQKVDELLNKKKTENGEDYCPPTFDSAIRHMPDSNLVVISLPGQYAAAEAKKALYANKHVLLFSDNVTIEQEKELKLLAVERGLLMMGPDCGTACINNIPLAFANVVKKGCIGIVGASGTGTQEIMVQIEKFGGGVSQVIGTGGRDLKAEIGGLMMIQGIQALAADEATEVIVLVSKPPAKEVAEKVLGVLKSAGKKAVVDFIGGDEKLVLDNGFIPAATLEEAAYKAVMLCSHTADAVLKLRMPDFTEDTAYIERLVKGEAGKLTAKQKYLKGLYSGGTICDEALKLFSKEVGDIYSNIPLKPELKLPDGLDNFKHCAIDLGDDEYTVGRPHPMIDSYTRQQMIMKLAHDEEAAVLLLDVVLGYGSNEDPAGSLVKQIKALKEKFSQRGQYISVVAGICGTSGDPQDYDLQVKTLKDAGVVVLPSNAQAVRFAIRVIREVL
ncbi:MAG: acyl-CoA synthetase FdrA [Bacillota bacterium]